MSAPRSCLVISDGRRGIENQALGLAEALGRIIALDISTLHFQNAGLFAKFPPRLQLAAKPKVDSYGIGIPADILIGCGRQAIAPLIAAKRKYGDAVFTVYVQDPKIDQRAIDLVVAPEHDGLSGNNVITMIGSPNRITPERLIENAEAFAEKLVEFPAPRAALLIGGPSKRWKLTQKEMGAWHDAMRDLHANGYSLLITPSRRTPEYARKMLAQFAHEYDRVWLHKDGQENPYFAFLDAADILLVTEDSTNMLTEACATGKPVYRLPMGGKPGKFDILFGRLEQVYGVKRFDGNIGGNPREAFRETERVARQISDILKDKMRAT